MKHPITDEFMMPVGSYILDNIKNKEAADNLIEQDGTLWGTAEDLSKLTGEEYWIVNEDFDPIVRVNYETGFVHCDERSGWGRTYSKIFSDLEDLAENWGVVFDVGAPTRELAEMGYRLIFAQYMADHGLSPMRYLKMPPHGFLPKLPEPEIDSAYFTAEQMYAYGKTSVEASKK
jgi:hypothetical protein